MEPEFGETLTALARTAVETSFVRRPPPAAELIGRTAPQSMRTPLAAPAATFVTLQRGSRLRGCIGTLTASRPLGIDVVHNARSATRDPRTPPVEAAELPSMTVIVAVLSPSRPLAVDSFAALLDRLRPGADGLTLTESEHRSATFLPSVWGSLGEPERFVAALLRKGGWPRSLWTGDLREALWPEGLAAEHYTADSFSASWAA